MIESFYDRLSPYYRYIFQDWNASVERQATILDEVIREFFDGNVHTILDAACGIGTQTIGLSLKGYEMTASDISSGEIEKARLEASKRKLNISFGVADMRELQKAYMRKYDLVIACDNAIPHLLNDNEIRRAFEQFYLVSSDQGGCMISVRDYAAMEKGGRQIFPRQVHLFPDGKLIIFDLWEFDGDYYDITMYFVEDTGNTTAKTTAIRGGRYYCISIARLEDLLHEAGFSRIVVLRERIHQPLLIGLKT